MSIKIHTILGYSYLYHSLLRFTELSEYEAKSFAYSLYTANLDSLRLINPILRLVETTEHKFFRNIERIEARPYYTEVQLYKALNSLDENIIRAALTEEQRETVAQLNCIMTDLQDRFFKAYGIEIFAMSTVFGECRDGLVPSEDEPSVCLFADLLSTIRIKVL
jgi:hypothetical protein